MISIIEHIEYLINRHDCVIIPGLGALIAQYTPAKFDMQSGIIVSPSRSISFNPSINHDDGLIADSVRRKEKVSFNEAQTVVNEEVRTFFKQLDVFGEAPFGKIGLFKKNEGIIIFEPYVSDYSQQKFFGLKDLTMSTLEKQNENSNIVNFTAEGKSKSAKRILSYAASILLLIGMSFILTTPIGMKQDNVEFASLNVIEVKDKVQHNINKEAECIKENKKAVKTVHDKAVKKESQIKQKTVVRKKASYSQIKNNRYLLSKVKDAKYYLVVASLPSRKLAEKHIRQCGNSNLDILESEGKFRVYIASSNSFRTLQTVMNSSGANKYYPGAWICKVK